MPNQHQNDPKMSYQMQDFRAHARELASGYKKAFSLPHARRLVIFFERMHSFNLGRLPDDCAYCKVETYGLTPEIGIDLGWP